MLGGKCFNTVFWALAVIGLELTATTSKLVYYDQLPDFVSGKNV